MFTLKIQQKMNDWIHGYPWALLWTALLEFAEARVDFDVDTYAVYWGKAPGQGIFHGVGQPGPPPTLTPRTPPPRNKGLIAGLIKGNWWLISPDHKAIF